MAWCLLMLATHPDVQQKACSEVMSVVGLSQPLTYDNLSQLQYCGCVINETLRSFACRRTLNIQGGP